MQLVLLISLPFWLIALIMIWLAFVNPIGAMAFIGRIISGFLGLVFLLATLVGIGMTLQSTSQGALTVILYGVLFIGIPFALALAMRWCFMKLSY